MFYFAQIAALAVCWLFYCELYWIVQRKVAKACSRESIRKRSKTLTDRLFFTPLSAKAHLGFLYYANLAVFTVLLLLTALHLLTGWIGFMQGFIRVMTTVMILLLGCVGASASGASTEYLCTNLDIVSRKKILALQVVSFLSEVILMLLYLYFAWAYVI